MSNSLRVMTALSTAVTAVCAVVLMVVVLSGNVAVRVQPLRTFDRVELSGTVFDLVVDQYPESGITNWSSSTPPCPASVAVKEGVTFTCRFNGKGQIKKVPVTVKDTFSAELEVGVPTP